MNGNFYLYSTSGSGLFYRSTDGGKTWTQAGGAAPSGAGNDSHVFGQIHAVPGYANNVWVSNAQGGLSYTTDGGESWTKVADVQQATAFGFGQAMDGQSYPAIYIAGEVNNISGIWRSIDQGNSWDEVGQYPAGIYDKVDTVSGDMNIAGRVYVGFAGNGYVYGDSTATGSPAPTSTPGTTQTINVQQTTSAPTIDGQGNDAVWSTAPSSNITHPIGSPSSDFAASFQTAWDSNNLYFLVQVKDASLASHTDMVEIYLDPKHAGGTSYSPPDTQYQFLSDSTTVIQYSGGNVGTNTDGVVQANQTTSDGYQTEVAIPWARLGITPASGATLGLDLDAWQDSGSGVKNKLSWNTGNDDAWTNPSVFGTATLSN